MNQRTPLLIAAALTAFMLVMVAGLATRLTQPTALAPTSTTATLDVAPALDPSVEALVREREAAYQQALAEANTRLEAANAQIAIANGQVATAPQAAPTDALTPDQAQASALAAPQAAPTYAFTPDQAQASALAAAPGSRVTATPELVSYEGTPAYEVRLDRGLIYVDAQSGAVLYNNAVPAAAQSGAVSQEQAIQAAIAYHNGGEVVAVHLDDEDSAQVYEVKFSDGSTIYIDAGNGQVVYAQIEDGGERDDD